MRFAGSCGLLIAAVMGISAGPCAAFADSPQPLKVAVSILPQAYFVDRVGGDHVDVEVLVGAGQSPHSYEPTSKQLAALSTARAYFSIGVDFERVLLPRLQRMFPNMLVVDTRANVPLRTLAPAEAHDHHDEHDADDAHDHDAAGVRHDPHIWLSPRLVKIQAQTICDTLCKLDPAHAADYRKNLAGFQADLDRAHERLAAVLAPLKGRDVFVFHPAYGYFCDEFGLKQVPVEIEGKEPTARQLATLIDRAKAAGVKVIFVEPQFSRKSAEAVAHAIGGAVVALDPLARDYLANLDRMADAIKTGLQHEQSPKNE